MSATELAFLRQPTPRGPSRPRYEVGPRPQRVDGRLEQAERLRVARLIREPRLRKGMLQVEAARQLGISQALLSKWERAKQTVPPEMRTKIADLYGFDIALIDGLDMAAVAATADERVLLNRFRAASEDERRAALAAVCP
ncbi:MAG: helix-turn-helix domain-containing protein [Methylobacterium organophilum]|nr:helix-turn-helix domain-containing protein [Methylobacterium organophilum]